MTETKDNSSLPLLMSITFAVVAVAVGGWFFLEMDSGAPAPAGPPPSAMTQDAEPVTGEATAETEAVADVADTDSADAPAEVAAVTDVDTLLRKARLAADADVLIFPEDSSALYYYGQVMDIDPQQDGVRAEMDAVLARVQQAVNDDLDEELFSSAFAVAAIVEQYRPDHELVIETESRINQQAESLIDEAIQSAQAGNDDTAKALIDEAKALPGRSPDYFTAVQSSLAEIRDVRVAAEQDRARRAQLAASEAKAAWVDSVSTAIADGNLITPAGASARDILAEENSWNDEREQLTTDLFNALIASVELELEAFNPSGAEVYLAAAEEMGSEETDFDALRASLEQAYIEAESQTLKNVSQLVQTRRVSPRYPQRALTRQVTGWVEVVFVVNEEGETDEIEERQSEPESIFDYAAVQAVERWQFEPVEYRGQVIAQRVGTRLVFSLE